MRTIDRSTAFKRDYKHALKNPLHRKDIEDLLGAIIAVLLSDMLPPEANCDHALAGLWSGYRECHIKPDLLLIYSKPDTNTLRLARLGSHSDLFG